jgi:hypothetical protein
MDKYRQLSGIPEDRSSDDPSVTADLLRSDFSGLIEIFDRHLMRVPAGDGQARLHIVQAKAAAERGLRLSHQLIALAKPRVSSS